ncbi:hypothetical protein KQX54_013785 [Cotesia glomerata]|uniref:Uncharacterized protein n=1 Tax=Cotesia glomerata TaxID=32391 RepID=A0AAV7IZ88_COTGL|nr:hypothetical protein KQX54_013785 [Cotesia glomerata]
MVIKLFSHCGSQAQILSVQHKLYLVLRYLLFRVINVSSSEHSTIAIANNSQVTSNNNEVLSITTDTKKRKITTPAQDTIRLKIQECESQLNFEVRKRDAGFGDDENRHKIKKLRLDLESEKSKLKTLQQNAERQQIFRNERNARLK